jgi:hypothetical protein
VGKTPIHLRAAQTELHVLAMPALSLMMNCVQPAVQENMQLSVVARSVAQARTLPRMAPPFVQIAQLENSRTYPEPAASRAARNALKTHALLQAARTAISACATPVSMATAPRAVQSVKQTPTRPQAALKKKIVPATLALYVAQ